jgi:hypothetical protein
MNPRFQANKSAPKGSEKEKDKLKKKMERLTGSIYDRLDELVGDLYRFR